MALQELSKARQLFYSAEECTGKREFTIDGITAGTTPAALATRPLSQLLASYPLGLDWYTEPGGSNLSDVLPRLRVVSHEIIAWLSDGKAHGRVNYSTSNTDNTREIQYWYDVGEEIQTVTHVVDEAVNGTAYSSTRLEYNRNYPKSEPVTIFNYQRSECKLGFWAEGTGIIWSALGGGTTASWEENAHSSTTSQFYRSQQLVGKLNSTTFLGQNSKTVLYLGATVSPQGAMYVSSSGNLYVFTVVYRFEISTVEHFQYRHPDTGDLKDVRLRGNFNTLGLVWPFTLAGTSLRPL